MLPARCPSPMLLATLGLGAVGGCDAGEHLEDRVRDPMASELALDASNPERCDAIAVAADDLLARTMNCAEDLECDVVQGSELLDDACLPQLLCWVPTSERADLDALRGELRRLDDAYRDACGACPIAICLDPDVVDSTCVRGTCELEVASPPDDLAALAD